MNIGMVLTSGGFPPDIRVEKEARSLMAAGHQIHLLATATREGQKVSEIVSGIHVHRVQVSEDLRSLPEKVRYYLRGVHEPWLQAIAAFARDNEVDALHVHDLPYVLTAAAAVRGRGIPLVFDMHGDTPAALAIHEAANSVAVNRKVALKRAILALLIGDRTRWLRRMERRALEHADHVIVVVDESKERLMKLEVPASKITVVMNCEDADYFSGMPLDARAAAPFKDRFVVSYIGGMEGVRGLDILIRSFPAVVKHVPSATLLLVGDGYMRSRLEELAQQLGLADRVVFTGWVDFSLVPTYLALSQVCAVPHTNNALTDTTIPHKLFQSMLMGKPVVALPVRPIRRILEETGGGVVARDESPEALAEAILAVADPERARLMGERGRQAAQGQYSWANEGKKIVDVYRSLLTGPKGCNGFGRRVNKFDTGR